MALAILPKYSVKPLITKGAILLLLGMLTASGIGVFQLIKLKSQLDMLVVAQNAKVAQLTSMRNAVKERSILLSDLIYVEDSFERDSISQRVQEQARLFIQNKALFAKTASPAEAPLLNKAVALVTKISTDINLFLDTYTNSVAPIETVNLLRHVGPKQTEVLRTLDTLLAQQESYTTTEYATAIATFDRSLIILVLLGVLIIGSTGIGTIWLIRRISLTEATLFDEQEKAQKTLDSIGDAVITVDPKQNITYLNQAALTLLGDTLNNMIAKPVSKVLSLVEIGSLDNVKCILAGTHLLTDTQGTLHSVQVSRSNFMLSDGSVGGDVLVLRDFTALHNLAEDLKWAVEHDPLTKLCNRGEFERQLSLILNKVATSPQEHTLLYIDLDQFKIVNDTCGHPAGDALLSKVTSVLLHSVRENDLVSRLGGDEFGILICNSSLSSAKAVAEKILTRIRSIRFIWDTKFFNISASIGSVQLTGQSTSVAQVMSTVDAACYVAKRNGRNTVHFHEDDANVVFEQTSEMAMSIYLSECIRNNENLVLFVQGIRPPSGKQISHYEVLIRLRDPTTDKFIAPMMFIPAAEKYGVMPALDRWVVETALNILSKPECTDMSLSINLSGQSLVDDNFRKFLTEIIATHKSIASRVCFEITETVVVSNIAQALQAINELKEYGVKFSLDDFGSGMASFGYLKQLPVDYLKIDGLFVKGLMSGAQDQAIVSSIIDIGHVFNLKIIAEFVENIETANLLKQLGADYVQGYGIHIPEPLETMLITRAKPRLATVYQLPKTAKRISRG